MNKNKLDIILENTVDLSLKRKARKIIKSLDLSSNHKILEVGSGDGYYPSIISRLGKYYFVGLEIDRKAIDSAEKNFRSANLSYERLKKWGEHKKKTTYFLEGDVTSLPFPDKYFDSVIMSEVAEHLPDDLKGLSEVYRVIKPKGKLILTVPNWYYPFLWDPINWILQRMGTHIKAGFFAGIWNQHVRLYKPNEIKNRVKEAGFKIKRAEVQTKWCLPFNHYIINLGARILANKTLPENVINQANKFSEKNQEKTGIVGAYLKIANSVDRLNTRPDKKVGTTIFVHAIKTSSR